MMSQVIFVITLVILNLASYCFAQSLLIPEGAKCHKCGMAVEKTSQFMKVTATGQVCPAIVGLCSYKDYLGRC